MKKKLLFASAIAFMMAGCAEMELEQPGQAPVEGKGIKFSTSIEEGIGTRAELSPSNDVFNTHWYADNDRIGVFYKAGCAVEAGVGGSNALAIAGAGWMGLKNAATVTAANPFAFKASGSGTNGFFVAVDDANVLSLKARTGVTVNNPKGNIPTFRAYWPVDVVTDLATDSKVALPALAAQAQNNVNGFGIVENSFMISESESDASYDADDNSVSKDRFSLKFKRVSPVVYFKINEEIADNANREYLRDYAQGVLTSTAQANPYHRFGVLKTVTLKAEGSAKVGTSMVASELTYKADAKWNMAAEKLEEGLVNTGTNGASEITTTMKGTGLAWSNDATAFMVIAPVNRAKYKTAGEKETVTATYTFANVQLTKSGATENSWATGWVGFPSQAGFNLDNEPYLAYAQGTGFVLELNPSFTGKIADIFDATNNLKGIKTTAGAAINKTNIKHFISKANITAAADFTAIKSLTALTNVTLLENTEIPAEAFKDLSNLVYLNLPKVTKVANVNAFPANDYTEVYMGSFDFSDIDGATNPIRPLLLKAGKLVKADVSAVANINAGFPKSGVTFSDFVALEEITVKSGVSVGGAGFQNCALLETVQFPKGIVNGNVSLYEGGNSQFVGCAELASIAISGTVIPDAAFKGCTKLESVVGANGKGVQPTSIGVSSFEDCKALENINLSNAATIGKAAFKGCTKLVGAKEGTYDGTDKMVLRANAVAHVSDNALENCSALRFISFANATTVGVELLTGTTCTEIEFLKAFTVNSTVKTIATTKFFGTTTGTKLFCSKDQTGVEVNVITLTGNVKDSAPVSTTFGGTIEKKY